MARKPYASDLSDQQWNLIKLWVPEARAGGRPRSTNVREVINAIFYVCRAGCAWRYLPGGFPPWQTVYDYYSKWMKSGFWNKLQQIIYSLVRHKEGRTPRPSLAIVDSQSVRSTHGEERARDCFKKVIGRKRSVLVDSLGFMISVFVHKGNDQDFRGLMALFHRLPKEISNSLTKILADGAYRFSTLKEEANSRGIDLEVLNSRKLETNLGKQRWKVERSISWFNHYRRLSKDYERTCQSSEAMIYICQIQLLLRRYIRHILFRHLPSEKLCTKKFA